MNSTLERRLSRLEQAAGTRPEELVECGLDDEAKGILRAALSSMGHLTPEEIEARVNQRYRAPCPHVASLSPVEREQRLLAIRGMVADQPAARALLDRALKDSRPVAPQLSPESNAILDEARVWLEQARAGSA